jgi:photosystem II stability/assembly factor-like uncharacterized protein
VGRPAQAPHIAVTADRPAGCAQLGPRGAGATGRAAPSQPFGGATIVDIATSPGLPNVLLVSLTDNTGWLTPQYSLDGGQTWHPLATEPWGDQAENSLGIAIAPRVDQSVRFIVFVEGVLYRSGDFGATWAQTSFVGENDLISLVASPADPQRLYLSTATPVNPMFPAFVSTLSTSADGGVSWSNLAALPDLGISAIPSPSIGGRFYSYVNGWRHYWSQSDDAGQTWAGRSFPVNRLAIDAQNPLQLYGLALWSDQISGSSSDGGQTWKPWSTLPANARQLVAHPNKSRMLFIQSDAGLYRSSDAGTSWNLLSPNATGIIKPDYSTPGRLLWARGSCLFASTTDGSIWTPLVAGCGPVYLPIIIR